MKQLVKYKNEIRVVTMAIFLFGLSLLCWFGPQKSFSDSERRVLAGKPKLSIETVFNGSFMKEFESFSLDQFPARDGFRQVKALTSLMVFKNKDNHGIYYAQGYLSKMEYPLQEKMIQHATGKMQDIYDRYLKPGGSRVFLSIVPDKNYFLAKRNGYLSLDYEALIQKVRSKAPEMEYIDIIPLLSLEDYYRTDTHWKQENLVPVAKYLANQMGVSIEENYEKKKVEVPFYGVYLGQSALPVAPDELYYLTNEGLEACTVTTLDTGSPVKGSVYDSQKAAGRDAYEFFLSGAKAIQMIENPNAREEKELIVFRDSFGSSLVPLLAEGYSKITLIDIRYVNSKMLGQLVEFHGQDVLFLYSTLILNNSLALK